MADINIVLPVADATQSVEIASVTPATISADMKVVDACENKNNSLHILVNATTAGNLTIKAGDNYPNAMLGDLDVACAASAMTDIVLEDISRFENRDNSIALGSSGTLAGTIAVVAKRAGLEEHVATRGE